MATPDLLRVLYLVLLLAVVGGWVFAQGAQGRRRSLKQAATWTLIFLAAIAGAGLWQDIRSEITPRQALVGADAAVEVPRARDGHYYLTLEVNGTPVDFVVDTGATAVVLSREDARRVGIDLDRLWFDGRARTANGEVRTASARIDTLALGPHVERGVRVWVTDGDLDTSLLGMEYLSRFARIEIEDGRLVLHR